MKKAFKNIRLAYTIFAGIELIGIALIAIFYFLNIGNWQATFDGVPGISITLSIVGANIIFSGNKAYKPPDPRRHA